MPEDTATSRGTGIQSVQGPQLNEGQLHAPYSVFWTLIRLVALALLALATANFGVAEQAAVDPSCADVLQLGSPATEEVGSAAPDRARPARIRALDMSLEAFLADPAAQCELFFHSSILRDRQEAFALDLLDRLGVHHADVEAELKRLRFAAFRDSIAEKVRRKGYANLSLMTDIVRGRIDVRAPDDVPRVVAELIRGSTWQVQEVRGPKKLFGIEGGYPRHHVILADPVTGMTYEWQVGTKATTALYERAGIKLGDLNLGPGMKPDLHTIEFKLFRALQYHSEHDELARRLDIPEFRRRVAEFASETGRRGDAIPAQELSQGIAELHAEASEILRRLVRVRGPAFVLQFIH